MMDPCRGKGFSRCVRGAKHQGVAVAGWLAVADWMVWLMLVLMLAALPCSAGASRWEPVVHVKSNRGTVVVMAMGLKLSLDWPSARSLVLLSRPCRLARGAPASLTTAETPRSPRCPAPAILA
jgi:hypothetical protein